MEKTVTLSRAYESHGETFSAVTMREPRFADLMALGEPYEMQRIKGGMPVVIENTEIVAAYVSRCLIKPGVEKLGGLGISDARLVRNAVLGFFIDGAEAASTSQKM